MGHPRERPLDWVGLGRVALIAGLLGLGWLLAFVLYVTVCRQTSQHLGKQGPLGKPTAVHLVYASFLFQPTDISKLHPDAFETSN